MNTSKLSTFTAATKVVAKRIAKRGMHRLLCAALALLTVGGLTANATTYTWTQTAGNAQNWEVNGNWSGGVWPTPVSGDTVDFSTVNIAANTTLTLQADRTAEIWKFGDTSNGQDWIVNSGNQIILAGTTPTINVVNRTATLNCVLGGSSGLTKTGAGQLTLDSTTSSLSGDIKIQAGLLYTRHAALGTGNVVFTGNSEYRKIYNTAGSSSAGVTVNPGVSATMSASTFYYNSQFSNVLAGDNTSTFTLAMGGNTEIQFNNTANTFEGELYCNGGGTADNGGRCVFKSLADSNMKIKINNSVFRLADGGVDMNFVNRPVEILADARIDNDSTSSSVEIIIAQDLIAMIGNNSKTLILSGVNTGANTFGGKIGNSASGSGAVSISKQEAGKWILTGANTYSGTTTISGGTLEVGGSGTLGSGTYAATISNAGTLRFNSSANQTLSGVISGAGALIQDGAGTLSLTKPNTYSGNTTVNAGTLSLGDGTNNSSLTDGSTLSVASGATLNLNYVGSDTVFIFSLGGSPAAAGEWGATGSGAANESTQITGTGRINNLGGDASSFNIGYWDGGTIDIGTDGNLASGGGNGTWNTTLVNWDYGFLAHKVWANTPLSSAVFAGTAGTVTLDESVSISNLTINTTSYTIRSNTLNFATAGNITVNSTLGGNWGTAATIQSAITGAPSVVLNVGSDNTETDFLPAAGSMQLGAKSGNGLIALGGSTTGNTLASASGKIRVSSGEWTLQGNASGYQHYVDGGTFIVNGQLTSNNRELKISTNATLVANGTVGNGNANGLNFNGNTEGVSTGPGGTLKGTGTVNQSLLLNVRAEATIAPGYPTGTLTITGCDCTINGKLAITVNGNQVSTLAVAPTKLLTISSAKLDVNVTATPTASLTIATYGVGKLTGTFLSNNLPNGWTINYAANGGTAITLTPPPAGTLIQFL